MPRNPEIFGKYHLLDKLATGGMAEVYRAKSYGVAGFEKTLVIKKILPNLAADKSFIEMFIDEAKIASALSHINIVQIFDLGEQEGEYFIAMEYVDGVDLKTLLDKTAQAGRSLPVNLGAYVVTEVAKGLDYAHRRKDGKHQDLNIVHRDVSPHNILISHAGEVKITDFGIARAASRITHTRSGIIRGKFAYMSPEQARGEDIDRRSDIFALGIVLWEVLTGLRLFKAKNDLETLKRVQTLEVVPPSRHNPDVRDDLDAIVLKALERDRDDRYDSGAELYEDLSAYLFSVVEKVGPTELSQFMSGMLASQADERSTDFDQFVSALDELEEASESAEVFAPDEISIQASQAEAAVPPSQEPTVSREVARQREREEGEGEPAPESPGDPELSLPDFSADDDSSEASARLWDLDDDKSAEKSDPSISVTEDDETIAKMEESSFGLDDLDMRPPTPDDLSDTAEPVQARAEPSVEGSARATIQAETQAPPRAGTQPVYHRPAPTLLRSAEVPFVGRTEEVMQLRDLLGHVARGDGQVIALQGAYGLGKSRLLRELKKLAEDLAVTVYLVRGHYDHPATPYHVMRSVLRQIIGAQPGDSSDKLRERVDRLAQLGLSETERQLIGALFDLEYIGSPVAELEGSERAMSFAQTFDKILRGLAAERPLILMVDDLDHADELSRRAIDHVAAGIGEIPMLVLVTAAASASELLPRTDERDEIHDIALPAIATTSTRRLVQAAIGNREVPDEVTELVEGRAGGNPLHTLALTRYLMASGALEQRGEEIALAERPEIPPALPDLAQATIALLPQENVQLLSVIAAWGEEFDKRLIQGLGDEFDRAQETVAELVTGGVLVEHAERYAFSHPVFRTAALRASEMERKKLYARAAMAVDVVDLDERRFSPLLCDLWIAAEEFSRARPHLQRAANALVREGGGAMLLDNARRLMESAESPVGRLRAALVVAELALSVGNAEMVWSALDAARGATDEVKDLELLLRIERLSARQALRSQEAGAAAECLERARQLLVEAATGEQSTSSSLQLARELTSVEVELARAWREAGEVTRAQRRCREALAAAEELREAPLLAQCYEEMARIHERFDEPERAMRNWDQAIGIWKKIGRRRALLQAFEGRGLMDLYGGALVSAKNFLRESMELAAELSVVPASGRSMHLVGRVQMRLEAYAQAQRLFKDSLAVSQRFALKTLARLNEVYLAALKADTGDVQESIRELEGLLARWESDGPDRLVLLEVELVLGNTYKKARRVGPTNKHYVRALQLARELSLPRYVQEITEQMKEAF